MFGSEILDVAIGMAFIFMLLSLVTSAVREAAESIIKARAVHLERGIRDLLDDRDSGLLRDLYNHPLVYSLFPGSYKAPADNDRPQSSTSPNSPTATGNRRILGRNLPIYIPSHAFARALIDVVTRGPADFPLSVYDVEAPTLTVERLRAAVPHVRSARLSRMLTLATDGAADLAQVQSNVERWFNDAMDQVTAIYRRRTQWGLLAIALVLVPLLNVDAAALINHLARNKTAREALVAQAEVTVQRAESARDSAIRAAVAGDSLVASRARALGDSAYQRALGSSAQSDLRRLDLPIGWKNGASILDLTWSQLGGFLVAIFAVSLGAPFWHDFLKRMLSVRQLAKTADEAAKKLLTERDQPAAALGGSLDRGVGRGTASEESRTARSPAQATPPHAGEVPAETFVPHRWAAGDDQEGVI